MALEELVRTALHDDGTVHGLVADRIYPMIMPQEAQYPALTYSKVSGNPENCLQGWGGLQAPRFSIDCWASSYGGAKALAAAVINAMTSASTFKAVFITELDLYEDVDFVFHILVDFSVWYNPNA